jgi:uncharacterized circularly permuted ATP-grasp superfamily protein/uncharacterized alpha-E superfamily protein
MHRPWDLDAVPLVIAPEEWERLAAALAQRVQLLNAVLADVYGPQTLLHAGLLPPALVFAHPGFLRPCHNVRLPQNHYLHLYAADLVRAPDGQWWVLADRTQSPSGAGYALENRLVLSRTLSDVFNEGKVERLAPFFEALRKMLLSLVPSPRDNPRIVLLTPGPYNETYFEHAYLARYLGYTLVEGGDLTVRDTRVFLKTLAGLEPVDVILRRQDDAFCDALELHQASVLGVAGLVQAVRAGHVAVANALGSGWLETPALLALLPGLCRHLLSEELQLPSVRTWWCGQQEDLAYVLDHLERVSVSAAFPTGTPEAVSSVLLSRAKRQRLVTQLRARPSAFVAQELPVPSTVPVWHPTRGVEPWHLVLRAYVVATPDGYSVMPGGLTRVSPVPDMPVVSMQQKGGSKDTWVVAHTPPLQFSLLPPPGQPVALRRSGYELPSRVADNLYWLGRYVERTEGIVRLLRSVLSRLTAEAGLAGTVVLPALLRPLRAMRHMAAMVEGTEASLPALEQALLTVMFDTQLSESVHATLAAMHRVASTVRDRISLDAWRILSRLLQDFTLPMSASLPPLSTVLELLNHTIITLAAFSGLGVENMTRGPGWHCLDMGRRLERAVYTVDLLRSLLVDVGEHEATLLDTVLEVADSSMTYRSRYLTTLQCAPVLDLLLIDDTNPRSVLYQLVALAEHVEHLPHDHARPSLSPAQRLALMALNSLRLAEIDVLCEASADGHRAHLETLLTRLRTDLPALSDAMTHHYLSHAETSRHLATSALASPP